MVRARGRWIGGLIAIAITLPVAAGAEPAHTRAPLVGVVPEMARRAEGVRTCSQPACAAAAKDDDTFRPFDPRLDLGEIAVASMEGLWLRRGPTLRNKPIMVSPIVVGSALTLALGGSF